MMQPDYFSAAFVQRLMQEHQPQKDIAVKAVERFDIDNSASILAVLTAAKTLRTIGHFGITVTYREDGAERVRKMVMKIKPHGTDIVNMLNGLAQACGGGLAGVYNTYKAKTGFQQTHAREQEVYKKLSPTLSPHIYGLLTDDMQEVYVILMEYLGDVELLNSVMQPALWTDTHIKTALAQLAAWHASMLHTTATLDMRLWNDTPSLPYMTELTPLWQALLNHAAFRFPGLYTKERVQLLRIAIDDIPERGKLLGSLPKTLVHNDCNPRNACFKNTDGTKKFCLYDWELCTFHIPQYDIVELLCFVLDETRYGLRAGYIEFYRQQLNRHTGSYTDAALFNHELQLAAYDFALHRIGMYMMAHTIGPYPFLPRVVESLFDCLNHD